MSYVTATYRPVKDGTMPIPSDEDGQPYGWSCVFSQRTKIVWFQDVCEAVAAICGDPGYLEMDAQSRLVARILLATRLSISLQARINLYSQLSGTWDKAEEWQRAILNGSRVTQPRAWSVGHPVSDSYWECPVPLVCVSTGYFDSPVAEIPDGPGQVLWLCPETDEDLLMTLQDLGLAHVYELDEVFE